MNVIRYFILSMVLAFSPATFATGNDTMSLEKMIHDMDAHWKQIISEKDDSRRQTLLDEHERMMNKVEKTAVEMPHTGHGMMRQHSANILEMHRAMMDTVR